MNRQLAHEAAPAWADVPPFSASSTPCQSEPEGGVRYWLVDDQVKIGAAPTEALIRRVSEVVNPDGLNGVASVEMVFDPACERVVVHFVRVLRGGKTRELPTQGAFEVFRRERDLERAKLDGRLTAHMIIPDLRVGDIVDYCFSIIGDNPAHQGLFASWPRFQWGVNVDRVRYRLLAPPDRAFTVRYWGAEPGYSEVAGADLVERVWEIQDVQGFHYEPGAPPEWIGHRCGLIAQQVGWPQIADLFRAAYAPPVRLPADLAAIAEQIAQEHPEPAARLAAALRVVQSEIRYLALGVGEGGLFPRPVEEIWASRFGDCKDSSRLLVALLTALEIEAAPALVNTRIGYGLGDWPACSIIFDHCIVRAVADGAAWWLDPTRSPQSGRLDRITQARFGWALPLADGAELEFMDEESPTTVLEIGHVVRFGDSARTPARLEVRATSRSWRADELRRRLATEGPQALARAYREFYESRYGALKVAAPLALTDRPVENEVDTVEEYELLEPWRLSDDGKTFMFSTVDEVIASEFTLPRGAERNAPIGLGWPRRLVQETTLHLPRVWGVSEYRDTWKVGPVAVSAEFTSHDGGRTAKVRAEVAITGRLLEAKDARAYFDIAEKARLSGAVNLTHAAHFDEFVAEPKPAKPLWYESAWARYFWLGLIGLWLLARAVSAMGEG